MEVLRSGPVADGLGTFKRTGRAQVPSPWQTKLPCSAVRSEERAEGAELEPSHVELRRQFARRNKAAGIGAPVGNATQGDIDSVRSLGRERLPSRIDITRP